MKQLWIDRVGRGPQIVLLHGLGGSSRYWRPELRSLCADFELVMPDLAGFGRSMHVPGPFDVDGQVAQLEEALAGERIALVVGHSMGALVACRLARRRADRPRVVLFNPPLYPSAEVARSLLRRAGLMERWLADGAPIAQWMCAAMCRFRRSVRFIAPWLAPSMPRDVARDGVMHTWSSFKAAFESVIEAGVGDDLWALVSGTIVLGDRDAVCPPSVVSQMIPTGFDVAVWAGGHHLPLECVARAAALVRQVGSRSDSTSSPMG